MKFKVYIDFTCEKIPRAFYVGKGTDARVNDLKRNKYHTGLQKKYGIQRDVIFETDDETAAFQKERELIQEYNTYFFGKNEFRGANFTLGGEGASGRVFSQEERQKCSERVKGEKHPLFGKKHTEAAKKKNSESNKIATAGEKNGMFGKRHSEETRRKISEKSSNYRHSLASIEKLRDTQKNRKGKYKMSPPARAKMSAARMGKEPWNKRKNMKTFQLLKNLEFIQEHFRVELATLAADIL